MAKQFEIVREGSSEVVAVIPDGKWVVSASSYLSRDQGDEYIEERRTSVVGPRPEHRYNIYVTRGQTTSVTHYYLVGDAPFGVIREQRVFGKRDGGLYFSCARQVHKGELGRRPQIVRPQFVREDPGRDLEAVSGNGNRIKARDRRRGKFGWARLTDVAALIKMNEGELLQRYIDFSHAEHVELPVIFADTAEEIRGKRISGFIPKDAPRQIQCFGSWQMEELLTRVGRDASKVWIRQGFALTVLYLHHLGHIPQIAAKSQNVAA